MKCNVARCKFNNQDGTCGAREIEIKWETWEIGDCEDCEAPVCMSYRL